MRYGFLLNQNTCIGCHACTVACKAEHQVPLGSYRTWVKCIETGSFPDVRRHFAVLRCNHCDDAPCISICPTKALFRRPDGIVDFNKNSCIGCKSCMQACPYDALHITDDNTAAKCNFCAHRVDRGIEPACVTVCPVQAIVVGDLDDPASRISRMIAQGGTAVRKPEKETLPKTFYLGAQPATIDPSIPRDPGPYPYTVQHPLPAPEKPADVREIYDVPHETPWGWKVWSYLWTKSIAAGTLGVAAAIALAKPESANLPLLSRWAPGVALIFIVATAVLLIFDLKRPERFWYLIVRPNFSSWLVWGGLILGAFGAVAAAATWIGVEKLNVSGLQPMLAWISLPLAAMTAGYTAFLFRQCRARDFWLSPILFPHLLAQAIVAGPACLLLCTPFFDGDELLRISLTMALGLGLAGHLGLTAAEVLWRSHTSRDAAKAATAITAGAHRLDFLGNVITAGVGLPTILLWIAVFLPHEASLFGVAASVAALWGLFRYERMWILAGQSVPLS